MARGATNIAGFGRRHAIDNGWFRVDSIRQRSPTSFLRLLIAGHLQSSEDGQGVIRHHYNENDQHETDDEELL